MKMMRKLFILLIAMIPFVANAQDILTRLDKALGVSLPAEYQPQFKSFVDTNKILCDEGSNLFIEQYIKDQMESNLRINKQNQLLFVWNAIYHAITDKYIYKGDDGNDDRLDEYTTVMDEIDECETQFRNKYIAYTKERSAEAKQRSAEAQQESVEATKKGLKELIRFYSLYKRNPSIIYKDEIETAKKHSKWIISNCKEYDIDYKSILSPEVLKFYGIE